MGPHAQSWGLTKFYIVWGPGLVSLSYIFSVNSFLGGYQKCEQQRFVLLTVFKRGLDWASSGMAPSAPRLTSVFMHEIKVLLLLLPCQQAWLIKFP